MTVRELIEHLGTLPADAEVIYRYHSEYAELETGDIDLHRAEDGKIEYRAEQGYCYYRCNWRPSDWPKPEFRTVVVFPGN